MPKYNNFGNNKVIVKHWTRTCSWKFSPSPPCDLFGKMVSSGRWWGGIYHPQWNDSEFHLLGVEDLELQNPRPFLVWNLAKLWHHWMILVSQFLWKEIGTLNQLEQKEWCWRTLCNWRKDFLKKIVNFVKLV